MNRKINTTSKMQHWRHHKKYQNWELLMKKKKTNPKIVESVFVSLCYFWLIPSRYLQVMLRLKVRLQYLDFITVRKQNKHWNNSKIRYERLLLLILRNCHVPGGMKYFTLWELHLLDQYSQDQQHRNQT